MTDSQEIEAKFEIDAESIALLSTLDSIGDFRIRSRRKVSQYDRYFDTEDGDLAAEHASFRVRRKDDGAEITFKGRREHARSVAEAHIAARLEDEVRIDGDTADRVWQGNWIDDDQRLSAVRRALDISQGKTLAPTAELLNDRIVVNLVDSRGGELELAIDTCRGTRLSDGRVTSFNELELELKQAGRSVLVDVSDALQRLLPGVSPNHRTKLERVLR